MATKTSKASRTARGSSRSRTSSTSSKSSRSRTSKKGPSAAPAPAGTKRVTKKAARPDGTAAVDAWLARLAPGPRAALTALRRTIRAAAPAATEGISYGLPAFKHFGPLVAYAAFPDHLGFYVMSGTLLAAHQDDVKRWLGGKGTLHFTVDEPLPRTLVTRLVKARVVENEARRAR